MLTNDIIERILARTPTLSVGVVGDLFLDRYLDIDAALTEPSLETGLDAYQVTGVRAYPGAAGTVINNLAALGVGRIYPFAVIGADGEGFELRRALDGIGAVDTRHLIVDESRRTPTYTKPMLHLPGQTSRELSRLDIKNRSPLARRSEDHLLERVEDLWSVLDAVVVVDQVSEADCGVITTRTRNRLQLLGERHPERVVLADSRERIGLFRGYCLKPNLGECRRATGLEDEHQAVRRLAAMCGRPVFCTRGDRGILVVDPRGASEETGLGVREVPAYPVTGPLDTVGAGDSTSAALACALAAGASLVQAAAFGNLVASITIQQLGVTGTASPPMVRERWRQVSPPAG